MCKSNNFVKRSASLNSTPDSQQIYCCLLFNIITYLVIIWCFTNVLQSKSLLKNSNEWTFCYAVDIVIWIPHLCRAPMTPFRKIRVCNNKKRIAALHYNNLYLLQSCMFSVYQSSKAFLYESIKTCFCIKRMKIVTKLCYFLAYFSIKATQAHIKALQLEGFKMICQYKPKQLHEKCFQFRIIFTVEQEKGSKGILSILNVLNLQVHAQANYN